MAAAVAGRANLRRLQVIGDGGIGSWLPVAAQILRPAVVVRHG